MCQGMSGRYYFVLNDKKSEQESKSRQPIDAPSQSLVREMKSILEDLPPSIATPTSTSA